MNNLMGFSSTVQPRGMGLLGILFFLFILLILLFLGDMAFIFVSEECMDRGIVECASDILGPDEEEQAPQGAVTASGMISGEYAGENHTVSVSLTFPLEGGSVTGSFSGDCDGSIKGTYAGGDNGAISGSAKGSCGFVFPASGSFS